jgi:hypothetical protein
MCLRQPLGDAAAEAAPSSGNDSDRHAGAKVTA